MVLPKELTRALHRRHRSTHVYLIARRGGWNLYRFGGSGRCYGGAHAANLEHVNDYRDPVQALGGMLCIGAPAAVVDLSVWGARRPPMHALRILGVASRAVRAIDLINSHGKVVDSLPAAHNSYFKAALRGDIVGLRVIGKSGQILQTVGRG
jgi:hypothetical protein